MTWKRPTSPVAEQFKSQSSAGKSMLTIFWDMEGAFLVHFTPKCETVNSQNYCDVLRTKLKPAIRSKRRGKLRCKIGKRHNQKKKMLTELKDLRNAGTGALYLRRVKLKK
jgi:hypothetical protein